MIITANEFRTNVGKYLAAAVKEDIIITKNGKGVAKLTGLGGDKVTLAKSLFSVLPRDVSLKEAREERLKRHERLD